MKTAWIIGASAGIGRALAVKLHSENYHLILSARDEQALTHLNHELSNKHTILKLDVSDESAIQSSVEYVLQNFVHIDKVLFMAAVYKDKGQAEYDFTFAKHLINVNLLGAINLSYCLIPKLLNKSKITDLILCASVAGYTGLPKSQPYSCSKAALINFAESLFAELRGTNIRVRLISPGFVKTRLTDKNDFHMPCIISGEQAAQYIYNELDKSNFEIHFPKRFTYCVNLLRILPNRLKLKITSMLVR